MSTFAQHQQAIREAAAAAVREATAALEDRITALEEQVLNMLAPPTDPVDAPKTTRRKGTTASATTAEASSTAN